MTCLCVMNSNNTWNTYVRLPYQPGKRAGRTKERSLHCNQETVFPVMTCMNACIVLYCYITPSSNSQATRCNVRDITRHQHWHYLGHKSNRVCLTTSHERNRTTWRNHTNLFMLASVDKPARSAYAAVTNSNCGSLVCYTRPGDAWQNNEASISNFIREIVVRTWYIDLFTLCYCIRSSVITFV